MTQVLLRRYRGDSPPVRAQISTVNFGGQKSHAFIRIKSEDGLDLFLFEHRQVMLDLLYRLMQEMKITPVSENGIIRGEAEPEHVSFVTIDDIAPHLPIAKKLTLLIERFRHTLPDVAEALQRDYKAFTGKNYTPPEGTGEGTDSQLEQDLAVVKPLASKLIKNGDVIYGGQAKIARAIGVKNAGAGHRRVKAVAEALRRVV